VVFAENQQNNMTSVSAYRVYRTSCCHDVFDEPMYASSNMTTVFDTDAEVTCVCGKAYSVDEMEFVGTKRQSIDDLMMLGIGEIQIPSFLRKKK